MIFLQLSVLLNFGSSMGICSTKTKTMCFIYRSEDHNWKWKRIPSGYTVERTWNREWACRDRQYEQRRSFAHSKIWGSSTQWKIYSKTSQTESQWQVSRNGNYTDVLIIVYFRDAQYGFKSLVKKCFCEQELLS